MYRDDSLPILVRGAGFASHREYVMFMYFEKMLVGLEKKATSYGYCYRLFGLFGFISYPLFYFIWSWSHLQTYEDLSIRLIASALCLPLIFYKQLTTNLQRFLPLYWNIVIAYCFPFFFTFMLIKNSFSNAAILNSLTGAVLLILLLDLSSLIVVLPLGIFAAWLVADVMSSIAPVYPQHYMAAIISYTMVLIFGALFVNRREHIQNKKIDTLKMLFGSSIAHELRTPLNSIKFASQGLKKYLPYLLETYRLAVKHNLEIPRINNRHFDTLEQITDNVIKEVNSVNNIIDITLMNVREIAIDPAALSTCKIQDCVAEAMERYVFKSKQQKQNIHINTGNNFEFLGDKLLIVHILFNLFKNALYFVDAARKGEVYIWAEANSKYNYLHFKDTAMGISKSDLPNIFESFYSKTTLGTGIGLAFSKRTMLALGGDISCESVLGEYTLFTLKFPK